MHRQYLFPLLFAALFLVTACVPQGSIVHTDNSLVLKTAERAVTIDATTNAKRHKSFSSLYLTQTILKTDSGNLIVYEKADIDSQYEFKHTLERTIDVIFEPRSKQLVMTAGNLYAYRLNFPKGVLNLVAQKDGIFTMKFLYGMNDTQFKKVIKAFDPNIHLPNTKHTVILHHTDDAILSKWDIFKVQFYPLVRLMPRMRPLL